MHAKHLCIPHLARPLSAKAYGVSQCLVFAREDCSDGLLRRIAQKDCLVGLSGCSSWGLNWFLKWGSHMPRTRVSGWEQGLGCTGNTSTWLGSQKSGGVGARVGGLRARLVWESAARGAFAACAVERRALCAAGQRGGGVGAHARRINTACPSSTRLEGLLVGDRDAPTLRG